LYFNDYIEIAQFLSKLEIDKVYVVTFNFIISWLLYKEEGPIINLSKPILITKNSNPRLISKFLKSRIKSFCDSYYLDPNILEMMIQEDGPGVLIKYREITLF
jgi:hypothetical protein